MSRAPPASLRWRCRRGMKELDLLLGEWLERRWAGAPNARRESFAWLVGQPDPELASWLLGNARPADPEHAALVDEIVRRPA